MVYEYLHDLDACMWFDIKSKGFDLSWWPLVISDVQDNYWLGCLATIGGVLFYSYSIVASIQ